MPPEPRPLWQLMLIAAKGKRPLTCDDCFRLFEYLADILPRDENGYVADVLQRAAARYLSGCAGCRRYYLQRLAEMEAAQQQDEDLADIN